MAELSKQALQVANNTDFPNNNTGYITPAILRSFNTNLIDSTVNQTVYTINSGSWNSSISQINAFTASQQPSFTALNSFTASQLTINSGYNAATYSLNVSVNTLNSEVDAIQVWTSSVNEIIVNGASIGTSTRFFFGGFASASIVPNVNGPIAAITILQDNTKLNTSSFNDYTASNAASQSVFSASVSTSIISLSSSLNVFTQSQTSWNNAATASITQLLDFSSSLDATYATDAQLNASSSVLQANIDTKLNSSSFNAYTQSTNNTIAGLATTSSFNDYTSSTNSRLNTIDASTSSLNIFTASINQYTASNNTKWNTIELLTGSYATTGSNNFIGNQNITGSITITGSAYGNVISASISTNTASIDLSRANYFTLTIANNTNINVINPQPGVTATLVINTAGAASASFSSNVKQSSGSFYVPSVSGNIDILSFTAVTTSSVYVVPAYTFV
jgi:hypothetical protein